MKVIIINGHGGAGKDTFIKFFAEHAGPQFVENFSTVDYIKEIATKLGWEGTKEDESRRYLSLLKEMATYWADIPFKDTLKQIEVFHDECVEFGVDSRAFIFIHCREPKEIQRLVDALSPKYPVYTLLIRRRGLGYYGNPSDDNVDKYDYDFIIENNYNLENLKSSMIRFYNKVR